MPLPELTAGKSAVIIDDGDGDGQLDPGEIVEWTITVLNFGQVNVPAGGYNVLDFLSPLLDEFELCGGIDHRDAPERRRYSSGDPR